MAAQQAPPSLEFSRQEHWSGLPFPSPMHESEKWKWSRPVVSHPQWSHGLQPSRLLHAWDFLGKSTGVGCHCLLQNVMIEHLKLINIYRTVYLKVANKQNMHYFQAHREHSLRYCTSVQFSSAAQSCPTLCDPMDCSMPSLHVHHKLPEFTQTHVHWVGDAI